MQGKHLTVPLERQRAAPIRFADHIEGVGVALFGHVCKLDLEGIVAKHKYGPYVTMREESTWFKIRNPRYSQWEGREELFERDRSKEPVPGWHSCELACARVQARIFVIDLKLAYLPSVRGR
jgi:hypothetical protein